VISRRRLERNRVLLGLAIAILALILTTPVVAVLEDRLGVLDASAVYLLAVVAVGVTSGTVAAALTACGAFLLYDFLFINPRYTLTVVEPAEWLNLVLLLVVGIVVGQLAAGQRNRAEAAEVREREARVLFQLSFALATRADTGTALAAIAEELRSATAMSRVWIWLGPDGAAGLLGADTDPQAQRTRPATYTVLHRMPGDEPARWVRIHDPASPSRSPTASQSGDVFRVSIEAGGRALGGLWAQRFQMAGAPTDEETRMLAAAADQIGQALEQDRLRAESTSAELARRSDAMKSALLDSVSHDLRTPLASIRAAAGSLMDPHLRWTPVDLRATARTIDDEAVRLNRLVTNLLDMSRIEAGGLRAEIEPFQLDDLVEATLERIRPRLAGRRIDVITPADLPLVAVDPTFMEQILTNVVENALKYAPPAAPIRIVASATTDGSRVRLTVEDGGAGVPEEALPRLFDKFYRVPRSGEGARRGTGVGLAVVRGLVETMHGHVDARRSDLGGLAVDLDLQVAPPRPDGEPTTAAVPQASQTSPRSDL
jgi:two-component system sensor histidine kinase KdpD